MSEPTDFLRVSYSSLNTYASCPRKFEFHKLYPRPNRQDEDYYSAEVGKALHAGFQQFLMTGSDEKAIWSFMQAFPYELEFNQENDYRNFDAALSTLEAMFEETHLGEYELAQIRRPNTAVESAAGLSGGVVVPAIEVPFEIRFRGLTLPDGRGVAFIGFIDAIMRQHLTGAFRTWDIKTSRWKLNDATGKYKFDTQQVPYGIVVDHVAQGEVDSFEVMYFDCYIDICDPVVKLYSFNKTQDDVREWVTGKVLQFQQISQFMKMGFFPRTDGGCLFYNKPCKYLEPCQSRDKDSLTEWFLLGEPPAEEKLTTPWIVADIELGEAA